MFLFLLLLFFFYYLIFLYVFPHHVIKGVQDCPVQFEKSNFEKIRIRTSIIVGNFRDFESLDSGTIQKSAISDFNSTVIGCDRLKALIVSFQSLSNRLCSIIVDFTSFDSSRIKSFAISSNRKLTRSNPNFSSLIRSRTSLTHYISTIFKNSRCHFTDLI